MTETSSREGPQAPRDLLAVVDEQLQASIEALGAAILDIRNGRFGAARDMAPALAGLRKALEAALHERARIAKLDHGDGAGGGGALDLGAARHEIGRRLACLHAARDGDGVSGQSE